MNLKVLAPIIIIGAAIAVLVVSFQDESIPEITLAIPTIQVDSKSTEFTIMETNGVRHLIPLDKIRGGGPPKDGIP